MQKVTQRLIQTGKTLCENRKPGSNYYLMTQNKIKTDKHSYLKHVD